MESEPAMRYSGGIRTSDERAIEQSGLLGTRRGWANIGRFEVIFLIVGILAACATDTLTIVRMAEIDNTKNPDLAYGILILVHSIFLLMFLITGIFYQRITDVVAFFISAVLLSIYVITHYVARRRTATGGESTKDANIRLIRLILTVAFNVCFLPLAILVIRDYQRDEFSKRVFGAFPAARRPIRAYNIFDCLARANTMLSISTLLLNLYNFNEFEAIDKILLIVGIPLALCWLGIGVGMVRLENRILVFVFYVVSLLQPLFLAYSLYSAIQNGSKAVDIGTTPHSSSSTTSTSTRVPLVTSDRMLGDLTTTVTPVSLVPVLIVLYVCLAANAVTHLLSMVAGLFCVRNFGKGLKERIFNNRIDKWFQARFSSSSSSS